MHCISMFAHKSVSTPIPHIIHLTDIPVHLVYFCDKLAVSISTVMTFFIRHVLYLHKKVGSVVSATLLIHSLCAAIVLGSTRGQKGA